MFKYLKFKVILYEWGTVNIKRNKQKAQELYR